MEILLSDFGKNLPLFVLICTVLIAIVAEAARKTRPVLIYYISLAGSALTAVLALFSFSDEGYSFSGMIQYGGYAAFFAALFNFIAFVTIILSRNYFESNKYHRGEFYILLLFSVIGMMLIASANDLIIIFLGIELMSFCLYALVGFLRTKERSNEASLKYFLLGAFTTGFLLYGIALIYGVAGTTNLTAIRDMFATISSSPLFFVGTGLLMIGISFKAAAVPFHMWVPDVYEGAPTPITGFMSTAAKAAAFAAFVIVFIRVFEFISGSVNEVIAILAAASMIIGNVIAVSQDNIKRMMAYSSIAHAGYMLCGVAAGTPDGQIGILYYLVAYAMMNLGVFAIISFIEQDEDKNLLLDDYRGLRQSQPLLSALMAVFMFALAGVPPFAGFFGKYYVFLAAVKANMTWLAIIGVLTSLVSAYYYLRIVVLIYFREKHAEAKLNTSRTAVIAVVVCAFFVLLFGLIPSIIVEAVQQFH